MANIGDRVLARWAQEEDWWYPGVVCAIVAGGYEVQYDDGDRAAVPEDQIRPLELRAGARIQCRYRGGPGFYDGVVASSAGSAIQVNYDDGDRESSSVSMVRVSGREL
jgi:hypothetical protein